MSGEDADDEEEEGESTNDGRDSFDGENESNSQVQDENDLKIRFEKLKKENAHLKRTYEEALKEKDDHIEDLETALLIFAGPSRKIKKTINTHNKK